MNSTTAVNQSGLLDSADIAGMLRRRARIAGSQAAVARQAGVSPQFLSGVMNGAKDPSPAILDMLGVRPVVRYEIKGSKS